MSTSSQTDHVDNAKSDELSNEDGNDYNINLNINDFVIRDGFPALRLARRRHRPETNHNVDGHSPDTTTTKTTTTSTTTTGPWIEGDEPLPRFDFWAGEKCFEFGSKNNHDDKNNHDHDDLERLWDDCRIVFSARTRNDNAAYSTGETFFLPSQMKPRCALEAMVQTIFQQHTSCLEDGVMIPEQSGAEWWTLVLDTKTQEEHNTKDYKQNGEENVGTDNDDDDEDDDDDEEVGIHFDADYGLEDQSPNLLLHPRVATVTYFTNSGPPTVVFNQRSPPPNDVQKHTLQGSNITHAWISHPQIGKHIAFDGRFLHGAPATFFPPISSSPLAPKEESTTAINGEKQEEEDDEQKERPSKRFKQTLEECTQRITLLVNIWVNHCPLDAEILDQEICNQLSPVSNQGTFETQNSAVPPVFRWTRPDLNTLPVMTSRVLAPLSNNNNTINDDDNNKEEEAEEPAGEEEVVICNRLVTIKYNVTMDSLHSATLAAGLVRLDLEKGVVSLEVGDEVQQQEADDDYENDEDEDQNAEKEEKEH